MDSGNHRIAGITLLAFLVCGAALLVAACGDKATRAQTIERYSEKLRESISTGVSEESRKSQMLLIADQLEKLQLRFSQETMQFVEAYRKLNADYDAPRPAFDQLFGDYNAKRMRARSEALELHFKLASIATEDEWASIGKAEGKLYEKVNESPLDKEHAK
jgi:hypothetical protein